MARNNGRNDSTGTLALLGLAGLVGYALLAGRSSGGQARRAFIPASVGAPSSAQAPAGGTGGNQTSGGGGGETPQSASAEDTSGGPGLPSGGDDAYSQAARDYYELDDTPSAPFGQVGEAQDRVEQINSGETVGL